MTERPWIFLPLCFSVCCHCWAQSTSIDACWGNSQDSSRCEMQGAIGMAPWLCPHVASMIHRLDLYTCVFIFTSVCTGLTSCSNVIIAAVNNHGWLHARLDSLWLSTPSWRWYIQEAWLNLGAEPPPNISQSRISRFVDTGWQDQGYRLTIAKD